MKYVLVTGGVVSGLGKGVTASSIGLILKSCGLRVTSIKIGSSFFSFFFLLLLALVRIFLKNLMPYLSRIYQKENKKEIYNFVFQFLFFLFPFLKYRL